MQRVVDGYTFTVLSRQMCGEYNSLLVRVEMVPTGGALPPLMHLMPLATPIAPPPSSVRLFVRSNSWGGMFRVCLQTPNSQGYLEKADDYTRGTFVKMELQLFFSNAWNRLPDGPPIPDEQDACVQAFRQMPRYIDRKQRCTGNVLYNTIEFLDTYKYDFLLPNHKVVSGPKSREYLSLSPEERKHFYDTTIRLGSSVSTDPTVTDPPTHCKIKGSIYRVSIRGRCNSYFYYALLSISSTRDSATNPMNLRHVNKSNRFVPLITVPQVPELDAVYDSLGIYSKYDIFPYDAKNIGKLLEYVQNCKVPNSRLCNAYVVNGEYTDSTFYNFLRHKTLKTKQKPKLKRYNSRRVRKALGIERS